MSNESDSQHGGIDQGSVLVSGGQARPVGTFQAKIAFGPSKEPFHSRAGAEMETPLATEEARCQEAFALPAHVVVNHKACLQDGANEMEQRIGKIAGIGA